MKKLLSVLMITIMLFSTMMFPASASNGEISVYLDSAKIEFDVPPQIINGRTMVPMRKIFESMGTVVNWDNATQTVTATNDLSVVIAQINNNTMTINGTPKSLDVPPQLIDGRTLVPARFVAEALGATVDWNGETSSVIIQSLQIDNDDEFVYGYEKANRKNTDSYISEGDLSRTKLYTSGIIDNFDIVDSNDVNVGYFIFAELVDDNNDKWTVFLNSTGLTNGNKDEYSDFKGKRVTITGFYGGYLGRYDAPYISVYKIRDENTKTTKYGSEAVLIEEIYAGNHEKTMQTMYTIDGRTKEVSSNKVELYRNLCWYTEPVQVLYAADGRTMVVARAEVDSYKNVGWYLEPLVIMHAADGRTQYVEQSKVEAQKSVGWYSEPVVLMYAADGRTIYVGQSEVEAHKNVGWYLEPVVTMYAADGRTLNVLKSEVEAHKKVGWFADKRDAIASKYPKHNVKVLEIGDIWYDSFNGVGFPVYWRNDSGKNIKYITFTVVPYNAVGDMVSCTITGKTSINEKYTGPFSSFDRYNIDNNYFYWKGDYATGFIEESPGVNYFTIRKGYNPDDPSTYLTATEEKYYLTDSDYNYVFDKESFFGPVWYNHTVKSVKITKIYVEYMDGTRETIKNPPIWKDIFVNAGL